MACLLIPIRLRLSRRPPLDPTRPLVETLTAELDRVRAQEHVLRTVLWWYLGPLGIGAALFVAGPLPSPWWVAAATTGIAAFCALLYRMNHRAVRAELEPRARELEGWIAGLRQGS